MICQTSLMIFVVVSVVVEKEVIQAESIYG